MKKFLIMAVLYGFTSIQALASENFEFINIRETFNDSFPLDLSDSKYLLLGDNNFSYSVWDGSVLTKLNFPSSFAPTSVNDNQDYIGMVKPHLTAGYWNNETLSTLQTSSAIAINNHGFVAGSAGNSLHQFQTHASLWDTNNNNLTDLGALKSGWNSASFALNDSNQVVGWSQIIINGRIETHAVLWQDSKIIELPAYENNNSSSAKDINNRGQILGESNIRGQGPDNQVIWNINGDKIDVQLIAGAAHANAINDNGDVVGGSNDGFAFIWHDGNMVDLNTLIDPSLIAEGWQLYDAVDINNYGWIIGGAKNDITGEKTTFLLNPISPVPEPTTWAMLLAGLGLLGYAINRKMWV